MADSSRDSTFSKAQIWKKYKAEQEGSSENDESLDVEQLRSDVRYVFADGGTFSSKLQNYSPRQGQIDLADTVAQSLGDDQKILMVEAGTGTGKTFSYLVPPILANKRIIVSTGTKALQDQLVDKDIPNLLKILGRQNLLFMGLKGHANYVCRMMFDDLPALDYGINDYERLSDYIDNCLVELPNYFDYKLDGVAPNFAEIKFKLREDQRKQITCDSLYCQKKRKECPYVHKSSSKEKIKLEDECFITAARKLAQKCNVITINHALFFASLGISRPVFQQPNAMPNDGNNKAYSDNQDPHASQAPEDVSAQNKSVPAGKIYFVHPSEIEETISKALATPRDKIEVASSNITDVDELDSSENNIDSDESELVSTKVGTRSVSDIMAILYANNEAANPLKVSDSSVSKVSSPIVEPSTQENVDSVSRYESVAASRATASKVKASAKSLKSEVNANANVDAKTNAKSHTKANTTSEPATNKTEQSKKDSKAIKGKRSKSKQTYTVTEDEILHGPAHYIDDINLEDDLFGTVGQSSATDEISNSERVMNLLPKPDVLVFDEAHTVPEVGRSFYTRSYTRSQLKDFVKDLKSELSSITNYLATNEVQEALRDIGAALDDLDRTFCSLPARRYDILEFKYLHADGVNYVKVQKDLFDGLGVEVADVGGVGLFKSLQSEKETSQSTGQTKQASTSNLSVGAVSSNKKNHSSRTYFEEVLVVSQDVIELMAQTIPLVMSDKPLAVDTSCSVSGYIEPNCDMFYNESIDYEPESGEQTTCLVPPKKPKRQHYLEEQLDELEYIGTHSNKDGYTNISFLKRQFRDGKQNELEQDRKAYNKAQEAYKEAQLELQTKGYVEHSENLNIILEQRKLEEEKRQHKLEQQYKGVPNFAITFTTPEEEEQQRLSQGFHNENPNANANSYFASYATPNNSGGFSGVGKKAGSGDSSNGDNDAPFNRGSFTQPHFSLPQQAQQQLQSQQFPQPQPYQPNLHQQQPQLQQQQPSLNAWPNCNFQHGLPFPKEAQQISPFNGSPSAQISQGQMPQMGCQPSPSPQLGTGPHYHGQNTNFRGQALQGQFNQGQRAPSQGSMPQGNFANFNQGQGYHQGNGQRHSYNKGNGSGQGNFAYPNYQQSGTAPYNSFNGQNSHPSQQNYAQPQYAKPNYQGVQQGQNYYGQRQGYVNPNYIQGASFSNRDNGATAHYTRHQDNSSRGSMGQDSQPYTNQGYAQNQRGGSKTRQAYHNGIQGQNSQPQGYQSSHAPAERQGNLAQGSQTNLNRGYNNSQDYKGNQIYQQWNVSQGQELAQPERSYSYHQQNGQGNYAMQGDNGSQAQGNGAYQSNFNYQARPEDFNGQGTPNNARGQVTQACQELVSYAHNQRGNDNYKSSQQGAYAKQGSYGKQNYQNQSATESKTHEIPIVKSNDSSLSPAWKGLQSFMESQKKGVKANKSASIGAKSRSKPNEVTLKSGVSVSSTASDSNSRQSYLPSGYKPPRSIFGGGSGSSSAKPSKNKYEDPVVEYVLDSYGNPQLNLDFRYIVVKLAKALGIIKNFTETLRDKDTEMEVNSTQTFIDNMLNFITDLMTTDRDKYGMLRDDFVAWVMVKDPRHIHFEDFNEETEARMKRAAELYAAHNKEHDVPQENDFEITLAPIEIGRFLGPELKRLTQSGISVVFASATITTCQDFSKFCYDLGLGLDDVNTKIVDSPFNYSKNARILYSKDFLDVSEPDRMLKHVQRLKPVIDASPGGVFFLTTSYASLSEAEQACFKYFGGKRNIYVQNKDSVNNLMDAFRRDGHGILIGTSSFWEGVDVPGQALSLVIIDKLPFKIANDPVNKARSAIFERMGKNSFYAIAVPEAIIKFRQGVGRLIRNEKDLGALIILDPRIETKRYGKEFIDSLPPMTKVNKLEEVIEFFDYIKEQQRQGLI